MKNENNDEFFTFNINTNTNIKQKYEHGVCKILDDL